MADTPDGNSRRLSGKALGRTCVILAAILWSTNGLFVKSHVFDDWPQDTPGHAAGLLAHYFAGVLVLPAVRKPRWEWGLVPMALAFTAMNVTFLQSMTLTTAANAIWLQSTAPLWVFLFGLTLYRDMRNPHDLVPLACGLAGAAVILSFELRQQPESRTVSACCWG